MRYTARMDTPLAKITDTLARHPELMLGIVFGSTADKTSTTQSDLDIAVAGARALSAEEKLRLIDELALDSNRAIDLVDLHDLHGPLLARLLKNGRIVLRREGDDIYPRLILRAIADEADFLPYRRRILESRRNAWTGN